MPWDLTTIPWIAYFSEPFQSPWSWSRWDISVTPHLLCRIPIVVHFGPSIWRWHLQWPRMPQSQRACIRDALWPQQSTIHDLLRFDVEAPAQSFGDQHNASNKTLKPLLGIKVPSFLHIARQCKRLWLCMRPYALSSCKTMSNGRKLQRMSSTSGLLEAYPWLWLPRCHPWTTDSMPGTLICGDNMNPRRAVASVVLK